MLSSLSAGREWAWGRGVWKDGGREVEGRGNVARGLVPTWPRRRDGQSAYHVTSLSNGYTPIEWSAPFDDHVSRLV